MKKACIVAARRTPFGRFGGALKKSSAVTLGIQAASPLFRQLGDIHIDQVIIGNVLSAGARMNIARQIGIGVGLPETVPAYTVNMVCGSGLHSIVLAAQAIECGKAHAVLCGGTESMSNAPHLLPRNHRATTFGTMELQDAILVDGLTDAFADEHMAATAERLARKYNIPREEQDQYAVDSQQRYAEAQSAGRFADELVDLEELAQDEHPRPTTKLSDLANLRPAFDPNGSVTAGNASGINDGAAMLVVADLAHAREKQWPILATIEGYCEVGCSPKEMGLGPVYAIRQLLQLSQLDISNFDAIEINEAFAAQVLACLRELELTPDRVNTHGGAIAMGHPIATSGARLATHLATHHARWENSIASLCIGGGQGIAMHLARPA